MKESIAKVFRSLKGEILDSASVANIADEVCYLYSSEHDFGFVQK